MNKNFKIAVIGSGTMGNGIAHIAAKSGFKTTLVDINKNQLDKALSVIHSNLDRQIKKNIISLIDKENTINNIILTTDINDCKDKNLVIEAIPEKYDLKVSLFQQLDSICHKGTIFASNTSSISISNLGNQTKRSDKVIGMHFMNPVPIMKLVEVINTMHTSSETTDQIIKLAKAMGKTPIQCNDYPGFVSNRILMPMINEAAYTFMEGVASANAIDQIMKLGMGHPMGPLKLADLIGIDVCASIMKVLLNGFNNTKYMVCPLFEEMIKDNKLGVKTGQGFYKY